MAGYGEAVQWDPERPRFKPWRLAISWVFTATALWVAAALLPGGRHRGRLGCIRRRGILAGWRQLLENGSRRGSGRDGREGAKLVGTGLNDPDV